jgi:hypothetical protein
MYTSLHRAVKILREALQSTMRTTEYRTPNEMTLNASEEFVPKPLAVVMKWLIDKKAFESADPHYESSEDVKRKYLTLAESAIFCSQKIATPFHFGLAIQMHHDYGKRAIIDTLNAHGICISYDDLRTVMTCRRPNSSNVTAIAYAPIIDTKPADMGTVFTTMIKCKEITNQLGQEITVQTMDQQLFAIAQQVK